MKLYVNQNYESTNLKPKTYNLKNLNEPKQTLQKRLS
jgi:hypothetical protein